MTLRDLKIKKKKQKKKSYKKLIFFIVIIGLVFFGAFFVKQNGASWFDPISIAQTINRAELKETDGRTNILLLGSDKRTEGVVTSELTDTLLVASIGIVEHDVVLMSLPRDLWVQSPNGYQSKINAIYSYGGASELTQVIEDVLGIPIHYYGVVNFELFKNVIDILGGVEVDVERSFTDYYYPIEGKENAPRAERYETVTFEQGTQTMNGETALKYARSRKGTNDENTDFARSERQQRLISAIKKKALSLETLINPTKLKELYDLYSTQVDTNISLNDIQNFYLLSQQIQFDKVISIVLDDRSGADEGGLLYSPIDTELYGGAYVLIPKTGDFNQLHAYVQRYLFSER